MRTGSMIFSFLQVPRCRIHCLANYWGETFHSFNKTYGNNSSIRFLSSKTYGLQEGQRKKWTRRPITTNTEGTGSTKSRSTKKEIISETILTTATVNVHKTQLDKSQEIQDCDIREISLNKDLSSLVTIIVFDIETTGFNRENDRIIEIALRDLQGGENSTFQTLVNPQRNVYNSDIHGIKTQMVVKPDVPRMEDLVPILLRYVQSRQKPGGYVLWVAHNARNFDVPFLIHEFRRCSTELPPNWYYVDTLPLGRERLKSEGTKGSARLSALLELYGIKAVGKAHRAMADVNMLTSIFPRLTSDLKLTLHDLVKKSFRGSDIVDSMKKNS